MLRTSVLRLGAGAAAAGAAARTTHADARPRLPVKPRATPEIKDASAPAEEDGWLEVSLNDEGLIFGTEEINGSVEEIVGLVEEDSDTTSNGEEADSVINVGNTSLRSSTTLSHIMAASQQLLRHEGVQRATMDAIRNNPELRAMIEDLSNSELHTVDESRAQILVDDIPMPPIRENTRDHRKGNPMLTMVEDISYHFSRLFSALAEAAGKLAKILRRCLSWLLNLFVEAGKTIKKVGKQVLELGNKVDVGVTDMLPIAVRFVAEFGHAGRAAPVVVTGAIILVIYMIAKRAVA